MILHEQWGMPPIEDNHETRDVAVIVEANIHHSDSVPPPHHADCPQVVRGFDRYHRAEGWACIGYSRVICSHGYVYQGRPLHIVPAAAAGHNAPIAAYCLIADGNNPATTQQLAALHHIVQLDEKRVGHKLKWTTHREVEPPGYTECPGDGIEAQVEKYRKSLQTKGN